MKILLMNVPDIHVAKTTADWDTQASDIGVFPPMGIMYLAGAISRQNRHDVKIIDTILNRFNYDNIVRSVLDYYPDIIGMTVYTPTLYDAVQISEKLHKAIPSTKIVWGGPHTMWFPYHKAKKDVLDLIDTAVEVDSDYAQFNICIAYYGTEIFNEGVSLGILNPDVWRDYAKNPIPNFMAPL